MLKKKKLFSFCCAVAPQSFILVLLLKVFHSENNEDSVLFSFSPPFICISFTSVSQPFYRSIFSPSCCTEEGALCYQANPGGLPAFEERQPSQELGDEWE